MGRIGATGSPEGRARGSSVPVRAAVAAVTVSLLGGQDDLEVVGELPRQASFVAIAWDSLGIGSAATSSWCWFRSPTNPYDANAIAVQSDGQVVGYLSRATAQDYLPGLQRLMAARGGYIALRGVIVGGGYYDDGPGGLGVWLEHNPADFGVHPALVFLARSIAPAPGWRRRHADRIHGGLAYRR